MAPLCPPVISVAPLPRLRKTLLHTKSTSRPGGSGAFACQRFFPQPGTCGRPFTSPSKILSPFLCEPCALA
jgi:hypothetical protein